VRASLVPSHHHSSLRRQRVVRAAIVTLISGALLISACSEDLGPAHPLLAIAAGDGQHALAGTELPDLIVAQLRDGSQRPIAGVRVTWSAQPGATDVIVPASEMTDASGEVSARWRLDETTGDHTVLVTAAVGATAKVTAVAEEPPVSQITALPLVTYEGSGQAVHPDFARVPAEWNGDAYRLVATPYPGGNASYENPSLYTSAAGVSWVVPSGVRNPLELPSDGSYLSDPDMVYDPDHGELRIYYRRVTSENEIWMIRSSNGVAWSAPVLTVHAPNHMIVSPTIVRRSSTEWLMWSVNSGAVGCGSSSTTVELRHSSNGVTWTAPEATVLADPDGFPWHIDVEWIPSRSEYWAVYPVKKAGSCTTDRLRFATSADGVHWKSYPSPLLMKGASNDLRDVVYRSSVDVDESTGVVSLWYSGARLDHGGYSWHLAWERVTIDALFARVNAPVSAAARIAAASTPALPQLTNETAP
jgi:hypothetical protein